MKQWISWITWPHITIINLFVRIHFWNFTVDFQISSPFNWTWRGFIAPEWFPSSKFFLIAGNISGVGYIKHFYYFYLKIIFIHIAVIWNDKMIPDCHSSEFWVGSTILVRYSDLFKFYFILKIIYGRNVSASDLCTISWYALLAGQWIHVTVCRQRYHSGCLYYWV